MFWEIVRMLSVLALLGMAGALATPRGQLPLALRGLMRILRRDGNPAELKVTPCAWWRRLLAALVVCLAVVLALWR